MEKKKKYTHYTHEERIAILEAYDKSGMSLHEFCEQTDVKKWTISNWLKDRRHRTGIFSSEHEHNQPFVSLRLAEGNPIVSHSEETQELSVSKIIIRRQEWMIEIPCGSDRTDVYQILSALEDLYAV